MKFDRMGIDMKKKIAVLIIVLFVLWNAFSLYASKYFLSCSFYTVQDERIEHPFRIVQLTDLHNSTFGEKNQKLVERVVQEAPDIILITGDLINETEEDLNVATDLITSLSKYVPVYVSYGNHETNYEKKYGVNIKDIYEKAGAKVLNFEYEDIEVNGQKIRLGGVYGYCLGPKYAYMNEDRKREIDFVKDFQDTDIYTVLMCHMPVTWIINNSLNEWDCDLVLCGHVHGGQIRFPFIGGLYAPDQGWFVGKEAGLYYSDDNTKIMCLSKGLGSNEKIPRFNNIPEITVIDMK